MCRVVYLHLIQIEACRNVLFGPVVVNCLRVFSCVSAKESSVIGQAHIRLGILLVHIFF